MKVIDKHIFSNGDILDDVVFRLMNTHTEVSPLSSKFDIMYCDPPWGIGALKMFDTLNSKMNNLEKKNVHWETFVHTFARIINECSHPNSIVIIEMGLRFSDFFVSVIENYTHFRMKQLFHTKYRGGGKLMPLHIMYFADKNEFTFNEDVVNGTTGMETVDSIVNQCAFDGAVILDPCCGFGRTMKIAYKYDMIFRGNEINKKRLDKAIEFAEGKYE